MCGLKLGFFLKLPNKLKFVLAMKLLGTLTAYTNMKWFSIGIEIRLLIKSFISVE